MSAPIPARWYVVNGDGLATLCKDEDDALQVAAECWVAFPQRGPYSAVLLGDVAAERERIRSHFRAALADTGITWPGEVDILYDKCFGDTA
jgi:hypothetical protein